jgi:hypothetical protein
MNPELKLISSASCLVAVCTNNIALAVAHRCPGGSFAYDASQYEDQGFGDFTGFYDWLRNSEGSVIGVRYLPAHELDFLCNAVADLPYVEVDWKIKSIALYFSDDRGVDESTSNDQEFGDNKLFKSASGTFALSFNVSQVIGSFSAQAASKLSSLDSNHDA